MNVIRALRKSSLLKDLEKEGWKHTTIYTKEKKKGGEESSQRKAFYHRVDIGG